MPDAVAIRTGNAQELDSEVSRAVPVAYSLVLCGLLLVATSYGLLAGEPYRAAEGVRVHG